MIAKVVGDALNPGIYEIAIHVQHIPVLDWDAPEVLRKFSADSAMSSAIVSLKRIERVEAVVRVLRETEHNGFPIVNERGLLSGLLLRSQLLTLLKHRDFQSNERIRRKFYQRLELSAFGEEYPRALSLSEVMAGMTRQELESYVDLTPYMHLSPYTVHHKALLTRVFRMFRTLGLRHLVVVNHYNRVVGMITRHDLAQAEEKIKAARIRRAEARQQRRSLQQPLPSSAPPRLPEVAAEAAEGSSDSDGYTED